jgi:hypothetical protein
MISKFIDFGYDLFKDKFLQDFYQIFGPRPDHIHFVGGFILNLQGRNVLSCLLLVRLFDFVIVFVHHKKREYLGHIFSENEHQQLIIDDRRRLGQDLSESV